VFLGDTMGELTLFYAASDVAFVGGSLMPIGGHNLLEPAALGLPLLSGPYVFNAQEIADMFIARHACTIVNDSTELAAAVALLLSDPAAAARMGDAGRDILERNRGALARLMAMIEPLVD
jgi:3-deoxy-D-manno-octulosonic-acid transferase